MWTKFMKELFIKSIEERNYKPGETLIDLVIDFYKIQNQQKQLPVYWNLTNYIIR